MTLENKISYNDLLRILSVVIIPIFIWGVNVEKRLIKQDIILGELKSRLSRQENKINSIDKNVRDILIQLSKISEKISNDENFTTRKY